MTDKRPLLPHPTDPGLRLVVLANNKGFATVDAQDAEEVGKYNWRLDVRKRGRTCYAKAWGPTIAGRMKMTSLHGLIGRLAGFGDCEGIDHENGDGLLNTRKNLRPANGSQNQCNGRIQPNNTSGFVGVHWHKQDKVWHANVGIQGKSMYLGRFQDPAAAALVRDTAVFEHHGEFAVLNFPRSCPGPKVESES